MTGGRPDPAAAARRRPLPAPRRPAPLPPDRGRRRTRRRPRRALGDLDRLPSPRPARVRHPRLQRPRPRHRLGRYRQDGRRPPPRRPPGARGGQGAADHLQPATGWRSLRSKLEFCSFRANRRPPRASPCGIWRSPGSNSTRLRHGAPKLTTREEEYRQLDAAAEALGDTTDRAFLHDEWRAGRRCLGHRRRPTDTVIFLASAGANASPAARRDALWAVFAETLRGLRRQGKITRAQMFSSSGRRFGARGLAL